MQKKAAVVKLKAAVVKLKAAVVKLKAVSRHLPSNEKNR
jgi:hypothetical protein